MMASFNQKWALIDLAKRYQHEGVEKALRDRDITNQPMDVSRYKLIRNAICYHKPLRALELIQCYPVKGGE